MQWGRGSFADRNKTPDAPRPDPSQEDGDDVYCNMPSIMRCGTTLTAWMPMLSSISSTALTIGV